jgi:hypothetical protein
MKLGKLIVLVSALGLAISFKPNVGWSTRVYDPVITGEVTAEPQRGGIEIAHHLYHIKPHSAADKALSAFHVGQNVDIVLNGPASDAASQIISITLHART